VELSLGEGWDDSSITVESLPSTCDGLGNWGFYNKDSSYVTGLIFGPCFSYDSSNPLAVLDSIPGNNFGENCINYTWTFCFSVMVDSNCSGGNQLWITATPIGDGTSGAWSMNTCPGIPFYLLDSVYCAGCASVSVSFINPTCYTDSVEATAVVAGGTPPFTYTWQPSGDSSQSSVITQSGVYSVSITDSAGCTASDTIHIEIPPLLVIDAGADTLLCASVSYSLGGTPSASGGIPPYHYYWTELPFTDVANPVIITADSSITYHLTVVDSNNCMTSDSVMVNASICDGINGQLTDPAIQVIPNPNDGHCIIRLNFSPASGDQIIIADLFGIEVFRTFIASKQTSLNLTGLPAGTYQLILHNINRFSILKMVLF
jgi:hypothetical protein